MTTVPKPADLTAGLTLKYDAWNRLVEVTDGTTVVGKYEYDGLNRRILNYRDFVDYEVYEHYYYNASWQVLETRFDFSGNPPEGLQPWLQYVWSARYIDALVLRDQNTDSDGLCDDERLYYLTDANFNVTALVDTGGTVLERYVYDPYGKVTIYWPDWSSTLSASNYYNRILYTGREYDPETGLYNYRRRPYSVELGRFPGRDPIGYGAGDANLYRYVFNNPVAFTDPAGLGLWCWIWTDLWHPKDYQWNAAMEGAGEYYLDNSADSHQALEKLGPLGNLASGGLKLAEGGELHQAAENGGRLGPAPGAPPGGGGIFPPGVPNLPGIPPIPPPLLPNAPVRPPAQNAGQEITELINDYVPFLIYVTIVIQQSKGSDDDHDYSKDWRVEEAKRLKEHYESLTREWQEARNKGLNPERIVELSDAIQKTQELLEEHIKKHF